MNYRHVFIWATLVSLINAVDVKSGVEQSIFEKIFFLIIVPIIVFTVFVVGVYGIVEKWRDTTTDFEKEDERMVCEK